MCNQTFICKNKLLPIRHRTDDEFRMFKNSEIQKLLKEN